MSSDSAAAADSEKGELSPGRVLVTRRSWRAAAIATAAITSDPFWGRFAVGPSRLGFQFNTACCMEWDRRHGILLSDIEERAWTVAGQLPTTPPLPRSVQRLLAVLAPTAFGSSARRIGSFLEYLNDLRQDQPPHAYLEYIGVSPDWQGRGHGASAMAAFIESVDGLGLPIYLETFSEQNLRFFGRYAFEMVRVLDPPGRANGWSMLRPPA